MLRDFTAVFRLRRAILPPIVFATMIAVIATVLGGCGIKGPLKPAPVTTPPPPTSTPGTSPPTPTGTSDPGEPESKP